MQWRNTSARYGLVSVLLHWSVALVVFGLFGLGFWMVGLSYYDPWRQSAPDLHKSIGILLFAVMLLRVLWRLLNPAPAPLAMLRGRHRHRLLVHARRTSPLQAYVRDWLGRVDLPGTVRVTVDVDPQSFL